MNYDIKNFPLDLVLNILGIIILFVIIRLLVYKPVKKYLDARRAKLNEEKALIADKNGEAELLKQEYEEKLAAVEKEATAKADEIVARATGEAEKIIEEANMRAEKVLAMAQEKLISEREASKKALEHDTVTMAFDIAEKILERKVNDSDTINMAQKLFNTIDAEK